MAKNKVIKSFLIKPTSNQLKHYVMKKFRFENGYHFSATEVYCGDQIWLADCLFLNGKSAVEVEIKVSMSDLKNDFKKKEIKHNILNKRIKGNLDFIPNKLYFAVPEKIIKKAYQFLKDTPYGLICIPKAHNFNDYFHWIKESEKFNEIYPKGLEKLVISRMSSEIINLRQKVLNLQNELSNECDYYSFSQIKVDKEKGISYNWIKE